MNCKNCHHILEIDAQFCDNCGAKVVADRITFKQLFVEFFLGVFSLDSKFFLTMRKMATHPEDVMNDYIEGVRKRYVNPFTFLAVGAGLSLLIFNYYTDEFIEINNSFQIEQITELQKKANLDVSKVKNVSEKELKILEAEKKSAQFQIKFNEGMMQFMLRYYNLLAFLFLGFYAILSKWTFRKPHNFGEHIVINAYAYGFITYVSIIFFILSITVNPSIYLCTLFSSVLYYMYVFGKFYKLSFGKNLLKLLRFIVGLIIITIIFGILMVIIGVLFAIFGIIKI